MEETVQNSLGRTCSNPEPLPDLFLTTLIFCRKRCRLWSILRKRHNKRYQLAWPTVAETLDFERELSDTNVN